MPLVLRVLKKLLPSGKCHFCPVSDPLMRCLQSCKDLNHFPSSYQAGIMYMYGNRILILMSKILIPYIWDKIYLYNKVKNIPASLIDRIVVYVWYCNWGWRAVRAVFCMVWGCGWGWGWVWGFFYFFWTPRR